MRRHIPVHDASRAHLHDDEDVRVMRTSTLPTRGQVEREIDVDRLRWVGPLTVAVAVAAVAVVRVVAVALLQPSPRFQPLHWGPPIVDTFVLVTAAVLVFMVVIGSGSRPIFTYRCIALGVLLLSFIPDLFLPGPGVRWRDACALMTMHVIAWYVTVRMLTTLTVSSNADESEAR